MLKQISSILHDRLRIVVGKYFVFFLFFFLLCSSMYSLGGGVGGKKLRNATIRFNILILCTNSTVDTLVVSLQNTTRTSKDVLWIQLRLRLLILPITIIRTIFHSFCKDWGLFVVDRFEGTNSPNFLICTNSLCAPILFVCF